MNKTLISILSALVLACFGAYLVNRDTIQSHKIKIEYIEKAGTERKEVLEKVVVRLTALEKTIAVLVSELKHFKRSKGSYAVNR